MQQVLFLKKTRLPVQMPDLKANESESRERRNRKEKKSKDKGGID